jgi:hypothetical protein
MRSYTIGILSQMKVKKMIAALECGEMELLRLDCSDDGAFLCLAFTRIEIPSFKTQLSTITYCDIHTKSEVGPSPCNRLSRFLCDTVIRVSLVARPLIAPVAQNLCMCVCEVFTSRTLLRIVIICCCDLNTVLNKLLPTLTQKRLKNSPGMH